jgi:ATP-dependent helicase/nuclease subunit A
VTLPEEVPPVLADAHSRERILTDLDSTLFVEAGAGTGKTTVLVARIVNLVASGKTTIDRLVAITFTEAAAAELRDRVREALERAAVNSSRTEAERSRCRQAALDIDLAAVSTIHAFAGQLLRTFPLEAGLPPGFATLDEIQQAVLFDERFRTWFWRDALNEPLRGHVKRALLLGLTQDSIRGLAAALEEHHDLLSTATTWDAPAPDPALPLAHTIGRTLVALQRAIPYAHEAETDPLVATIHAAQSSARQLLAARTEDDALSALLGLARLPTDVAAEAWNPVPDGRNAGEVASQRLERINTLVRQMIGTHRTATLASLLGFVCDFVLAGVHQRRSDGVANFYDLLTWARDLLRDNPSVRRAAQARSERILIDEFQDTDPLQAEIAFYLAADERELPPDWRDIALVRGKLFVVGDPKQSIYRFRGADIAIYDELLERLKDCRVHLTHNFRSVRPVLDWVNHHFERHMHAASGFQPEYTSLAAQWPSIDGADCGVRRVGALMDAPAAEAADAEAQAFAALARGAVEDGWLVNDVDPHGDRILRPAAYRDICILLPVRTHLRRLERALERMGVPYRVEAGKLVLDTQEVRDVLACLRAIEDPSDQVALVAALRSPAYACSDVDLLRWVEGGGQLNHEDPGEGPDGPVKDALASLSEFHHRRLLVSAPALIEAFMADRMLIASAFAETRPREAWRRLRYVVSRARAFTSTGRHTLRAFLDWIEGLQRADVRDPETGSAESDEDAIHIQTIHSAKGLEYPIVFLGGLGSTGRGRHDGIDVIPDRRTGRLACKVARFWQTPDYETASLREKQMADAETVRLLYVAATRARDHLVLSLFRGSRSSGSVAAIIERHLMDASEDLCPSIDMSDRRVTADLPDLGTLSSTASDAEVAAEAERSWLSERRSNTKAKASQPAHSTWWSADAPARNGVQLLASIDGVLVEEHIDVLNTSPAGDIAVLQSANENGADLRAGRVAAVFEVCTGRRLAAIDLLQPDGSTVRLSDLQTAIVRARADLHSEH